MKSARIASGPLRATRLLFALIVVAMGLVLPSCGSSHAILQISAPASVTAGVPFSATVTAMYNGQRDTIIDGPIHFTTSDKAAQLPTLIPSSIHAGTHPRLSPVASRRRRKPVDSAGQLGCHGHSLHYRDPERR